MAGERNNDDIADALHGLGEGSPETSGGERGQAGQPRSPGKTVRPAAPTAAPTGGGMSSASPAPAKPQAAGARRVRAASPMHPPVQSTETTNTVESSEATSAVSTRYVRKNPYLKSNRFRQTAIPVLLTTGVMLLVMAAARSFADEAAPLARLPAWTGITLVVTGLLAIALAVFNMLLVARTTLRKSA